MPKAQPPHPPSCPRVLRVFVHGYSRYSMRGYGIVSRRCSRPQIQVTTRSMPMPNPPCGTRAVAAQVEVPLERLLRQLVLLDALQQQVEVVQALAAADDLAVALGRQHVDAQRAIGLVRIRLHVERLHRRRVVRDADRPVELLATAPSRRCRPGRCRTGRAAPCPPAASPPRRSAAAETAPSPTRASTYRAPASSSRCASSSTRATTEATSRSASR